MLAHGPKHFTTMLHTRRLRENNFLTLDSYYRPSKMRSPFIAIIVGVGTGFLLTIGGQKLLNAHAKSHCNETPGHQLITLTSFIGDATYCLPRYATGDHTAH